MIRQVAESDPTPGPVDDTADSNRSDLLQSRARAFLFRNEGKPPVREAFRPAAQLFTLVKKENQVIKSPIRQGQKEVRGETVQTRSLVERQWCSSNLSRGPTAVKDDEEIT